MMHRQKVKLLLSFATLLSVLALVVVPALAYGFTLKVEKPGDGTGTVISDDGKINCGAVCVATYGNPKSGKLMALMATLTATPDEGSVFVGWGQDCGQCAGTGPCSITMNADRTCAANFGLPVGGIAVPVNRLELLGPWVGLVALASLAALAVALVRRRS